MLSALVRSEIPTSSIFLSYQSINPQTTILQQRSHPPSRSGEGPVRDTSAVLRAGAGAVAIERILDPAHTAVSDLLHTRVLALRGTVDIPEYHQYTN